jgi:hypothetical protein
MRPPQLIEQKLDLGCYQGAFCVLFEKQYVPYYHTNLNDTNYALSFIEIGAEKGVAQGKTGRTIWADRCRAQPPELIPRKGGGEGPITAGRWVV